MPAVDTPFSDRIETFPNQYPGREYSIDIMCPEFTSMCPKTGQPDFGTITIMYTPERSCVELKGLKLYLQQYRNQGVFYETVVNRILDDFVRACQPRRVTITGSFTPRGGITTSVTVSHEAPPPDQTPAPPGNWAASPDIWSAGH